MGTTKGKFDKLDRERVIEAIQRHYGVSLERVGKRNKWLRDAKGRNWWVLGGSDGWHGLPEEMMRDAQQNQNEGMLVIAWKEGTRIDVFVGPLGPLVDARGRLSRSETTKDYQFTVETHGEWLRCRKVPNLALKKIDTFTYSADDREQDRNRNEARKLLEGLSSDELAEVLATLLQEDPPAKSGST